MRAILKVRPRAADPFQVEIGNTATIGRSRDNAVCLSMSPHVSRQHAIIRCHNAFQYQIMDLGSRNGTFLDGRRVITPATLHHGAVVRITDVEILFEQIEESASEGGYDATIAAGTDVAGQETAIAAIMVCDIRGFSTMSEKTPEELLARTLGEWFRDAGNLIQQTGGTIDKFIGDAILAYWIKGAPEPEAGRAFSVAESLAVQAARRCWQPGGEPFRIAVALHHGQVTCGNIGLVAQRDATIIGDAVNTVFRIESAMKPLGQEIAFSGEFVHALGSLPPAYADLGEHQLRGKNQPVHLYGRQRTSTITQG